MKKLIMIFLFCLTSTALFAFDGRSNYGAYKNNIGFGLGYQSQALVNDSNSSFNLYGTSLHFKREVSIRNELNRTLFFESNLMIPFTSTINNNGLYFDSSLLGVDSSDILFMDFILGSNYSTFKSKNTSSYIGSGIHSYYMFYENPISSRNYLLYGFGLSIDGGLQYYFNSSSILEFGTTATFDFINLKYDGNQTTSMDYLSININATASIISRF